MGVALKRRELFQWGAESTAGTAVAATERQLIPLEFSFDHEIDRTNLQRGYMLREVGDEILTNTATTFSGAGPLLFDQFHTWMSMAVEGGVSASGSGDNRSWSFQRTPTGVPDLDTYTLERQITDGSTDYDREVAYAMLSSFSIDWQLNGLLNLSVEGFARRNQSSTFTSLTGVDAQPVTEKAKTVRTIVYMDDTYAGIGSTQVSSKVIGGTLRFNTGAMMQPTMDNRTDLDWTLPVYNADEMYAELTLRCLLDPAASANSDLGTENTKAEAAAKRFVRIVTTGSDIGTGTARSLAMNLTLTHTAGSVTPVGEENGQQIVEFSMVSAHDGTNPWFRTTVVNAREAFADGTAAA